MSNDEFIFFYGTLRKNSKNPVKNELKKYSEFLDTGYYQGLLYLVSYFPGVIPSSSKKDIVIGDVYSIKNSEILLPILDVYEEYHEGDSNSLYVRKKEKIRMNTGKELVTWMYIYNFPVDNLPLIKSGDFFNY